MIGTSLVSHTDTPVTSAPAEGYDAYSIQQKWQARWAEADPVPGRRCRRQASAEVRAGDVPVPVRRPAHGTRRELRLRRRRGALLAPPRLQRAEPDRVGLVRSAGRERGDQGRCRLRPARVDVREHRAAQEELPGVRLVVRLVAHPAHQRPRVLPLEPVAVPAPVRARPGVPQGEPGQLVPERPDGARQRAGRRRPLRALRRRGRQEEPDAVVLQDHRLRRSTARRPEPARGFLAAEGPPHAAELDRPLGRRRHRLRDRGPRRQGDGVLDAPRHAARRDLHGRRARQRPRRRARRGLVSRGAHALPGLSRACAARDRHRAPVAPTARRRACSSTASRSTP